MSPRISRLRLAHISRPGPERARTTPESLSTMRYTYAVLGRHYEGIDDSAWRDAAFIQDVLRLASIAPTGRRFGRRALGLGVDAARLAIRARISISTRRAVLAANPWIGVAFLALGYRHVAVIGIYAPPQSRSFSTLRRHLGSAPVVTTARIEADAWNAAGGRARHILFGSSFGYPPAPDGGGDVLRIFIGGTSDRDPALVAQLTAEALAAPTPVEVLIADGSKPREIRNGDNRVRHCGYLTDHEFGERLSVSQVAYLPLQESARAAGHMVAVGALESGVPVVTTATTGMAEYMDGHFIRATQGDDALSQLRDVARQFEFCHEAVRAYWRSHFSLSAYIQRVGDALAELSRCNTPPTGPVG
jgi:hypothetical protein